jgi:hypothetical protein
MFLLKAVLLERALMLSTVPFMNHVLFFCLALGLACSTEKPIEGSPNMDQAAALAANRQAAKDVEARCTSVSGFNLVCSSARAKVLNQQAECFRTTVCSETNYADSCDKQAIGTYNVTPESGTVAFKELCRKRIAICGAALSPDLCDRNGFQVDEVLSQIETCISGNNNVCVRQ